MSHQAPDDSGRSPRSLSAPWRIDYIRGIDKPNASGKPAECFLCDAVAAADDQQRRQRLVLWTTDHSIVLINRYPYTNGHLLVAPRVHKADLEELSYEERCDLMQQTIEAVALLKRAVSAQGFNIGANLGRCAGAGVPGHVHQHVVPRWSGDVNFMQVIGEVRIVPQAVEQLWNELVAVRKTGAAQ